MNFYTGLISGVIAEGVLVFCIYAVPFRIWGHWGDAHFFEIGMALPILSLVIISLVLFFRKQSQQYKFTLGMLLGVILFFVTIGLLLAGLGLAGFQADF